MLYIDHNYINLLSVRLERFTKKRADLYNCRCPLCGDSKKNSYKARGFFFAKKNNFFYRCHNCGASMSLSQFLKIFDAELHQQYTLERWKENKQSEIVVPKKQSTNLKFYYNYKEDSVLAVEAEKDDYGFDYKPKFKSKLPYTEKIDDLPNDHPAKKYIRGRKIPKTENLYYSADFKKTVDELVDGYNLEENDSRIVIPFFDENKNLIYLQGRSLGNNSLRYITIKINDGQKVYGLDRIDPSKTVYVTEGPIDSLFLDNAVAMAGSDIDLNYFNKYDDVVFIYDNEPRNLDIVNKMSKIISSKFGLVIWPNKLKEKDINDMILTGYDNLELQDIISKNTTYGLETKLKLATWRRC